MELEKEIVCESAQGDKHYQAWENLQALSGSGYHLEPSPPLSLCFSNSFGVNLNHYFDGQNDLKLGQGGHIFDHLSSVIRSLGALFEKI